MLDAARAGQIRLTLGTWGPIGNPVPIGSATDNFYGRGNLTVENTSQQALTLYMPIGTLFPPNTAGEQTMAAYSTNLQVSNPQQSAQQPNQLPNTGAGDTSSPWLLAIAAVGLLAVRFSAPRAEKRTQLSC